VSTLYGRIGILNWATSIPRWLTLGNQLGTDQIFEEDLAARINERCALLTVCVWAIVFTISRKGIQNVGLKLSLSRMNESGKTATMRERTGYLLDFSDLWTSCMDMHNLSIFQLSLQGIILLSYDASVSVRGIGSTIHQTQAEKILQSSCNDTNKLPQLSTGFLCDFLGQLLIDAMAASMGGCTQARLALLRFKVSDIGQLLVKYCKSTFVLWDWSRLRPRFQFQERGKECLWEGGSDVFDALAKQISISLLTLNLYGNESGHETRQWRVTV
jgi:hypothetical protein